MKYRPVQQYLRELKARDIHVWADDGKLRINAPKGALTEDLKQELGQRKSEIIEYLESGKNTGAYDAQTICPATRDRELPLSFDQQRMWFIHQLDPNSIAYNLQTSVIKNVSPVVLNRAWNDLLKRHEILRTVYTMNHDGDLQQRIHDFISVKLPVADLSADTEKNYNQHIIKTTDQLVSLPFDLAAGPVWRAKTLLLSENRVCFILVIHHIASDGWSLSKLTAELSELCDAHNTGREPLLAELPLQYADYALWQRNYLQGEVLEQQLAYWRESLAHMPAMLEMPADYSRPAKLSGRAGFDYVVLPENLTASLRELAKQNRATLFMTLLAVFKILLYRYSGQNDIVVGMPIAGRTRPETENVQGLFLNNLVLRTEVSGDMVFTELLDRVKKTTLGAYAHQDMPFERLVEEFHPERDLSRNPMFQIMFNSLITQEDETEILQADLDELFSTVSGGAQVDLAMHMHENRQGIRFYLAYSADLYDRTTIRRMLEHYVCLLNSAVDNPGQAVSRLTMLAESERIQLLDEWNSTEVHYPADLCLHHLFEQQAARTPDAIAVEYKGNRLSYGELDRRANRLAHYLVSHDVGPGELVGVYMERSIEMIIALYAILKAGGAYVPFDPEYPRERIAFMLEDTRVRVLLTQSHLSAQLPGHEAAVLCLDSQWQQLENYSEDAVPVTVAAHDPAYVIFTSGSTGRPKGVMNAHRGIVNRILWMQDTFTLGAGDAVLQKTPYSFDVSVWEFFWPLMAGARLAVAGPGEHKDPHALLRLITEHRITTLHFVPSMLQAFLEHADIAAATTLESVLCSGEALSLELQQRFFEASGAELHNLYGPTEAAVDVSHWVCRRQDTRKNVPIGKPVANTRLYILDPNGQPVPVGVPGELHIGGVQVAMGYLNRDELNAEKFIPDPFSRDPQARLYKTGDRARYCSDGNIEYLGRFDHQVKLRGLRIEPGEIENALLEHEAISAAVVRVHTDGSGEQRLIAYACYSRQTPPATADIRECLKKQLPDYMVPATVMWMDSMPLTASGKIDRNALPEPDRTLERIPAQTLAPSGELEVTMANIWSELLELDDVQANDMFFDLGGHSLLTLKVVTRFEHKTGKRINPGSLVTRTLRQVVAGLDENDSEHKKSA